MIDWYVDYQMPSLLQPGNLPALKDANYFIYTNEPERISAFVSNKISNLKVQVLPLANGRQDVNACFKDCASRIKGHLAAIPPDLIFGDCSLKNLEVLCEKYDLVVYGFPRCRLEVVEDVIPIFKQNQTLSNAQLVSLAMKHLHRETSPPSVRIIRTAKNIWEVRHSVPNPVLKISERSLALLNSIPSNNGLLDHCVPFLCVEAGMSYHYVQSSEEVFLVEPTHRRLAFCPTAPYKLDAKWEMIGEKNMTLWGTFPLQWIGTASMGDTVAKENGMLQITLNKLGDYRRRMRWAVDQNILPWVRRILPK
jgi:hypothetical protein